MEEERLSPSGIGGSSKIFPAKASPSAPWQASFPPDGVRYLFGDGDGDGCAGALTVTGLAEGELAGSIVLCLTLSAGRSTTLCTAVFLLVQSLWAPLPASRGRTEAIADARYTSITAVRFVWGMATRTFSLTDPEKRFQRLNPQLCFCL